ncbi:hypothetical protein EHI8A_009790 [Entamoeba histolytica HM-1:IMSS-B]|uniref:PRA1 family protein n=6 Tax=Entamoeba histolytica TaxID=5759 RepID=C4M638_ENTH1|nr:hypothetical protein EHI_179870 [Entamoeba histolytica HM-1:IMSS]EMD43596.1 Hypothetical protein EHI5A_007290 [Entamoeba histolytica KU27]EMH72642.1 hypothetical protein EHI8A_009790 [Entamoeba histolytica HM-1:IMSS-B]EMS17658.1 hypothetical protein KM1_005660 [Entamoeba histolytica HM-3:IMSS]ENY64725.1 hypothetical protein EHI7A_011510 [Entamoeba histolytica HM-1:IMSS-A]GAT96919.1 hypothetical protein CL6EHI_179870 [Entamoeba histolytica]|eukprot:XP_655580.2 hypothetical protein EHI_179870 [Entamoeba histolytica HM-1:IMSS]
MNQEETIQTTYNRVNQERLDDVQGVFTNDMFNERIDIKTFIGSLSSYSIPTNAKLRFENNIITYLKYYIVIIFILLLPSEFLSFKFFFIESVINIILYFFGNELSKKLSQTPMVFILIYLLTLFTLCLCVNRLIIWLLYLIAISLCSLHALIRTHVEELFINSF